MTLHWPGPTSSTRRRSWWYARSWLRLEENQYLSVPLEVARTLDDDLLRLLGYARGAYALGYVDDGRDPLDVVRDRTGTFRFGTD